MYAASIALVVIGSLCYHLSNRAVNQQLPPGFALVVTYATALVIVVLWSIAGREAGRGASLKNVNWPTVTLGVGVVLIEAGFLLAYRAGWKLSTASLVANVGSSLLLVVIGVAAFGEELSRTTAVGLALALAGLVLINYRP